jgi:hypothetical protein
LDYDYNHSGALIEVHHEPNPARNPRDDLLDKARKLADELNVSLEAFVVNALIDHIAMHRRIERLQKNPWLASQERLLAESPDVLSHAGSPGCTSGATAS